MAEKEERYISITQMVAKENIETEKYQVMPRQDAINRMAKALGKIRYANYTLFMKDAEAALNALLGETK